MKFPLRLSRRASFPIIFLLFACASHPGAPDARVDASAASHVARNLATVDAYYAAAEELDLDAFAELWADDGQFLIPWLPTLDLVGKDAIRKSFAQRLGGMTKISATRDLSPLANGEQVFVRAGMTFQYTNGLTYSNTLIALFTLDEEGKIQKMEEWPDLETFRQTFGVLPGR